MPRDEWDKTLDRLKDAGILKSFGRIRQVQGNDQFSLHWSEPIIAAAQADVRIIGLMQEMLGFPEWDRIILSAWLGEIPADLRDALADAETPVSDE